MTFTNKGKKAAVVSLVVAVAVGGLSIASVTASDNDTEKQRAIDNATKIVNPKDPPRLPVLNDFGDTGNPVDVTAVKAAVPDLIHRYKVQLMLPGAADERASEIRSLAKKEKRAGEFRSVFAASVADTKIKAIEDAIAQAVDDPTFRPFTDHQVTIDKWYGVTVDGHKAFAGFHGKESVVVPDMAARPPNTQEGQWHVWLERDGDVWKLVDIKTKLDAAP